MPLFVSCVLSIPEASLPADEELHRSTGRIEAATGMRYRTEPVRTHADAAAIEQLQADSLLFRPTDRKLERDCFELLRATGRTPPPAAASRPRSAASTSSWYDTERRRVVLSQGADSSGREADLARTEALALALVDQHVDLEARTKKLAQSEDQREALVGFALGTAHAATLEASTAPVFAFDASAAPIRRQHRLLTECLLLDPDGAPAELLVDPDLPAAQRRALELLLETSGLDRRRQILRRFAGARLVLEAKDRITNGNLGLLGQDLPRSTEQLMHPEKYLDNDDPPIQIDTGGRDGLVGPGFSVVSSGIAGEFGLFNALEGALLPEDACAAAAGWGGDHLTVYQDRDSERRAFAWRLEFDDRWEAAEAAEAFEKALLLLSGGRFEDTPTGGRVLRDGQVEAALQRKFTSFAVVHGGDARDQERALIRLLGEAAVPVEDDELRPGGRHDFGYRALRAIASPILYDAPGRFDTELLSAYGLAFRHRIYASGAEHWFLNPCDLPLLGLFIPEEISGLLFAAERSPDRNDTSVLMKLVRWFDRPSADTTRFWSPFFSFTDTPEYWSFGVLLGFLYEQSEGAGRQALSPRPVYSRETGLDGREVETGVLFDAVRWRGREGVDRRLRLLPYGALLELTLGDEISGMELGMFLEALRIRARTVVPGEGHFDLALLDGWLLRAFDDDASGNYEWSLLKGVLIGADGGPRRSDAGLLRLFGRSFLGFGQADGDHHFDFLFLRFGEGS